MIRVIAMTQFAFLVLGTVALKILVKANGTSTLIPNLPGLSRNVFWLFAIPPLWAAFAAFCDYFKKAPFTPRVAQGVGVVIAVACFLFMFTVTFWVNQ